MPQLKRRHFFQLVGSAIASMSLGSCNFHQQKSLLRSTRGIQNSPRKLALLVGINAYPSNSRLSRLNGCLTDVELQRHLLTYRFGFNPKDILTLTNEKATRAGILQAFENHLIQQAKSEDVVIFHYSGHGSQVADPDKDHPDGLNSTLVPFDSSRPADSDSGGTVQDITGHTLWLLMTALETENVTVVLDCCYSGGAKRGNLQVRAVRGGTEFQASPEEKAYQQQWLARLNLTPAEFKQQRRTGVAKGVVITATTRDQLAADYPFGGFNAGAFTYLMSQYFWQQTNSEPILNAIPNIAQSTTQISHTMQTPEFEVKPGSDNEQKPLYFLEKLPFSAQAVITQVEGKEVELWLGGIDAQSLAAFEKDAIFTVVDASGKPSGRVQLGSRQGLVGRGQLLDAVQSEVLQPGALCLEQVRGIPSNLSLRIGLDSSLGKDTAQAKAALEALNRIKALPLQQGEVDYIFGRMTDGENGREFLQFKREQQHSSPQFSDRSPTPPLNSLGLFSPGLEVIPDSFGAAEETVIDAVTRLQAKFKSLLAARIVKMTLNTHSSQLNVTASLSRSDRTNQLIAQVSPTRSAKTQLTVSAPGSRQAQPVRKTAAGASFSQLPLSTPVELQIANNEPRPLYISVLAIAPTGEMTILFPNQWAAVEETARVEAGQVLLIPDPSRDTFELQTQEPLGVTEVLILASVMPLRKVLKALQAIASRRNQLDGPVQLNAPIEIIEDLLTDLAQSSSDFGLIRNHDVLLAQRVHRIDTTQLAALSITFEVV